MAKAVVLDVDGVLVVGPGFKVMLEQDHGITPEMTDEFFQSTFRECLAGAADLKEVLGPHLNLWGWRGTLQGFLDYWFRVDANLDEALLRETDKLRAFGIPCYLATNQERHRADYLLNSLGFRDRFDGMFSSATLGCRKPDPVFFERLSQSLSHEPRELLFWDDQLSNVETARQVGLQAEVYQNVPGFVDVTNRFLMA